MRMIAIISMLLSIIVMIGIAGGVELGAPITNLLWCIPCLVWAWVSAKFSGFMD